VFKELLAGNMNLGRPQNVQIIFGSRIARPEIRSRWFGGERGVQRADKKAAGVPAAAR